MKLHHYHKPCYSKFATDCDYNIKVSKNVRHLGHLGYLGKMLGHFFKKNIISQKCLFPPKLSFFAKFEILFEFEKIRKLAEEDYVSGKNAVFFSETLGNKSAKVRQTIHRLDNTRRPPRQQIP